MILTITVGAVIQKCEKYKLTINYPQHGAQCKIFLMGSWMMMRKGKGEGSTHNCSGGPWQWSEGSWVYSHQGHHWFYTTMWCKALKETCWKKAFGQIHLQFSSAHLNDLKKMIASYETKQFFWHQRNHQCLEKEKCWLWFEHHTSEHRSDPKKGIVLQNLEQGASALCQNTGLSWKGLPGWHWPKTSRSTIRSWHGLSQSPDISPVDSLWRDLEVSS